MDILHTDYLLEAVLTLSDLVLRVFVPPTEHNIIQVLACGQVTIEL